MGKPTRLIRMLLVGLLGSALAVTLLLWVATRAGLLDRLLAPHYTEQMQAKPTFFLGIPTMQVPTDMWNMQELISELQPDYIIETGTWRGGSALYFATLLEQINENGKVITVDLKPETEEASQFLTFRSRVHVIAGDSVSSEVIGQIKGKVKEGSKVLVTLDSLHSKEHVAKELELYSPLVSAGSYIIVQDTHFPGLNEAIDEFLEEHENFTRIEGREKYAFTKYKSGFLYRTR